MNRMKRTRWIAVGSASMVAAVVARDTALQLAACRVPPHLIVACTLPMFGAITSIGSTVADALVTKTYRCPVPGCRFKTRLCSRDAAEHRRHQEAAASHPTHI